MRTIDDWRRERAELSRVQFVALHPYAFLVSTALPRPVSTAKVIEFRTQVDAPHATLRPQRLTDPPPGASDDQLSLSGPVAAALRKAPGNPYPDRISVGRARNCDVVIRDGSVSKLHGHFQHVSSRTALYADAKSSNGTYINGVAVVAGTAVQIQEHGLIALGRVRLQLLSPDALYDWLQSALV